MKVFAHYGVLLLFLAILWQRGWAQDKSCLKHLTPCLKYLNGTKHPPDSCCNPLKSMIRSNKRCLCALISNKVTKEAEKAGMNINEAQQLPGRCGQHVNPLRCLSESLKHKKSVHNSGSVLSDPSRGMTLMTASFMTLRILWAVI